MSLKAALLLSTAAVLALSGPAMAADLPMPAAPAMAAPAPGTWDGPYIGASVGYGWGTATNAYTSTDSDTGTESASLSGGLVGVQAGYNFHLSDNVIGGLEGNIDWLNETGSYGSDETQTINWEGSIRARLGVDMGQFLPYVEAGVAFANSTYAYSSSSVTNTHTGWTVGAGVEFMLADHLSANVEYRYSDYGTQTYTTANYTNNVHLTDSTVRLGLNYHF